MVWVWSVAIVLLGMYVIPLGISYYKLWQDGREERGPRRVPPIQRHVPHGV